MDSQAAAIDKEGMARGWIQLPERRFNPVRQILRRILYALIVLTAVAILVMIERKVTRTEPTATSTGSTPSTTRP